MDKRAHLLDCVMEECAEMIVAASKMQRFGDDETDSTPFTDEATGFTACIGNNIEVLEKEYNDLIAVLQLLYETTGIALTERRSLINRKKQKLRVAMQYSEKRGMLDG